MYPRMDSILIDEDNAILREFWNCPPMFSLPASFNIEHIIDVLQIRMCHVSLISSFKPSKSDKMKFRWRRDELDQCGLHG